MADDGEEKKPPNAASKATPKAGADLREEGRRVVLEKCAVAIFAEGDADKPDAKSKAEGIVLDVGPFGSGVLLNQQLPHGSRFVIDFQGRDRTFKVPVSVVWCTELRYSGRILKNSSTL